MRLLSILYQTLSQRFESLLEAGTVGDGDDRGAFADATDQAGDDASRAEFEELRAVQMIDEIFDTLGPANAAGDLIGEGSADDIGLGDGLSVDVADHGYAGLEHRGIRQRFLEADVSAFHET